MDVTEDAVDHVNHAVGGSDIRLGDLGGHALAVDHEGPVAVEIIKP